MLALAASVFVLVAAGRPRWKVAAVTALVVTLAIRGVGPCSASRANRRSQICQRRPHRRGIAGQCRDPVEPAQRQPRYYAGRITMRFEWLDPDEDAGARVSSVPSRPGMSFWTTGSARSSGRVMRLCPTSPGWTAHRFCWPGSGCISTPFRLSVTECALDTPHSDPSRRSGQERGNTLAIMKKRSKRLTANGFLRTP